MRTLIHIVVMASAVLLLGSSVLAATNHSVHINDISTGFTPASVTVKVGDSVTWFNDAPQVHDVVFNNGSFTGAVYNNKPLTWTATTAGTFTYYCARHPSTMTGVIYVSGPPAPPSVPPTPQPTPSPARTTRPAASATASASAPATNESTPYPGLSLEPTASPVALVLSEPETSAPGESTNWFVWTLLLLAGASGLGGAWWWFLIAARRRRRKEEQPPAL
jgi:plastocyanin